jgi:single-strand DNA-binding protein
MTYMNKVELKGFLGADAQPKSLDGGKTVLNFSLATKIVWGKGDERQERTEWHRVTAWDKVANQAPELTKGAYVHVIGTLRSREYSNGEGKVQTYDVVASKIEILPRDAAQAQPEAAPETPQGSSDAGPAEPQQIPADQAGTAPKSRRKRTANS